MSSTLFLHVYSNGDIWISDHIAFTPGTRNESSAPTSSESGTLVKCFQINSNCVAQKITTLTGSGNSSASALAATGGSTTKSFGSLKEIV